MRNTSMLFAVSAVLLSACSKEDQSSNNLSYQVRTTSHSTAVQNSTSVITWTSGTAFVHEIEFEAESNNREIEYKSEVKKSVNLFDPLSALGSINVPPGFYKEISFEAEIRPSGSEPVLLLKGQFVRGTQIIPVVLKINDEIEIEVEKENLNVTAGNAIGVITTYHLSRLSQNITETMLLAASRNASGEIEISMAMNANLFSIVKANLRHMGEVEIDD